MTGRAVKWACVVVAVIGAPLLAGPARAADPEVAPCVSTQLSGEIRFLGAAAGNRDAFLYVTNQGHACTVYGYSALELTTSDGTALLTQADQSGTTEPPSTVVLQTSDRAVADLHWIPGPCFTAGDDGTLATRPATVTVTPPDGTTGFSVPWTSVDSQDDIVNFNLGFVCGEPDGPAKIDITAYRPA
jgi:hypothetical protein